MKLAIDRYSSVTSPLGLNGPIAVRQERETTAGQLVVVKALGENPAYPDLELVDGSRSTVRKGQVLATVLGSRQALRGFVGHAPNRVRAGDVLHLLNLGGVTGVAASGCPELGMPIPVELLGVSDRHLKDAALPSVRTLKHSAPIVLVAGSCMNVGKTVTTEKLIAGFTTRGMKVGGAKITGVGCLKDAIRMRAAGAVVARTFLDCGVPSTADLSDVAGIARSLAWAMRDVDVLVMELGDGILGHYRVERFFDDRSLMRHVDATVFVASDLVAAWGGRELLAQRGVPITVVTGPATDNAAGVSFIEETLGLPAANALHDAPKLLDVLAVKLAA